MPQYLLSVWHDDDYSVDFSTPEMQRVVGQVEVLNTEMQQTGTWVFAAGLRSSALATVLRSNAGELSMTDGPYAETKEQMGGFWVIDVPDLDAALELAGRATMACERPVEVRPMEGG